MKGNRIKHRLVMGRCFFLLFREGVIEKYINEKKVRSVSRYRCTFAPGFEIQSRVSAALGIESKLYSALAGTRLATRKQEKHEIRKREYYEIHDTINDYHCGLRHLLCLSDYSRHVLCERQSVE